MYHCRLRESNENIRKNNTLLVKKKIKIKINFSHTRIYSISLNQLLHRKTLTGLFQKCFPVL